MPAVKGRILILIAAVALLLLATFLGHQHLVPRPIAAARLNIDDAMLDRIASQYGSVVRQRFVDWQQLMVSGKDLSESEKLQRVNDFFNRNLSFVDDTVLWNKKDYWATPVEFLYKGAGDCEDFAIAKYFTLLEMGVDDSKLRITYVKALRLNQAHMVLTFFTSPQAVPLVLDNLTPTISPANERSDLQPVYSFNGRGLWLAKFKGGGKLVGYAEKLNPWIDLKSRILKNLP